MLCPTRETAPVRTQSPPGQLLSLTRTVPFSTRTVNVYPAEETVYSPASCSGYTAVPDSEERETAPAASGRIIKKKQKNRRGQNRSDHRGVAGAEPKGKMDLLHSDTAAHLHIVIQYIIQ